MTYVQWAGWVILHLPFYSGGVFIIIIVIIILHWSYIVIPSDLTGYARAGSVLKW